MISLTYVQLSKSLNSISTLKKDRNALAKQICELNAHLNEAIQVQGRAEAEKAKLAADVPGGSLGQDFLNWQTDLLKTVISHLRVTIASNSERMANVTREGK